MNDIPITGPECKVLPEVSKMDDITDRLKFLEEDWAICTDLCSHEDVKSRKALMRNIMIGGMTYLQHSITAWVISKGCLTETPRNSAEQLTELRNIMIGGMAYLEHSITAWAINKDCLTETPCNPAEQTELAKACETFRMNNPCNHVAEELADAVIRCFQIAGEHNIPLIDVILTKIRAS